MTASATVEDRTQFLRGITFKPNELIDLDAPDAVVCMRTKNVQSDLDERDLIAVPRRLVRNKEKLLREGDVLLSTANSWELVGKCSYVPKLDYDATAGGFISVVRAKKGTHPRFLYHWLNAPKTQFTLRHLGRQTTNISNLDVNRFKALEFPDFAYEEQRRIAAILDKADAIRRKREQALSLADDLLKSTFLEMFGDPVTNPKGWPVEPFGDILTQPLRNGVSPSSRGTVEAEVLTLSAITGLKFDASARKPGKFVEAISASDQVSRSDFYICRGNGSPDLIGRGYFADQDLQGVAFPDTMIAAKPNPKRVTRGYLEAIWQTASVRGQILRAARTTNGTFKINQTATSNLTLPLPPIEAQRQFERITSTVRSAQARYQQDQLSEQLFASLSQRAFRGEL